MSSWKVGLDRAVDSEVIIMIYKAEKKSFCNTGFC